MKKEVKHSDEALILADALQEGLLDVVNRMVDMPVEMWEEGEAAGWMGCVRYSNGEERKTLRAYPGPRLAELYKEGRKIWHDRRIFDIVFNLPDEVFVEIAGKEWTIPVKKEYSTKYKIPFPLLIEEGKVRELIDRNVATPHKSYNSKYFYFDENAVFFFGRLKNE